MVATCSNISAKGPAFSAIKSRMKNYPCGLMPFRQFMDMALYSKEGFYNRVRFGKRADGNHFSTAPYQHGWNLGSSIGVFVANAWEKMGRPKELILAEAGPGEGKMMDDTLMYLSGKRSDVFEALNVKMVEVAGGLVRRQKETLAWYTSKKKVKIDWIKKSILDTSLQGKFGIFVSNECLDQLPFSVHGFSSNIKENSQDSDRFYYFKDMYVRYNDEQRSFEFVPVNEVALRNTDELLMEWEITKNRSLIKGHDFSASPETLSYLSFLCSNNIGIPELKKSGGKIVAAAPDSLSSYVKSTLPFGTSVSLFLDYGTASGFFPGFKFLDGQRHLSAEPQNLALSLNEPGERDLTFGVDFRWTHKQAVELGAEAFTTARFAFYESAVFPTKDKIMQFVQILSRGNVNMADLVDLPYRERLRHGLTHMSSTLFEASSRVLGPERTRNY